MSNPVEWVTTIDEIIAILGDHEVDIKGDMENDRLVLNAMARLEVLKLSIEENVPTSEMVAITEAETKDDPDI